MNEKWMARVFWGEKDSLLLHIFSGVLIAEGVLVNSI